MSRFLVYTSPAVGHTVPLVPGLLELQRRGHGVHVRALPDLVPVLESVGLEASAIAPDVLDIPITDFRAGSNGERLRTGQADLLARARHDGPDFDDAVRALSPDAVLVDINAYGAQVRAEAAGLPRATVLPSVVPIPERGIPPYGLGLRPARGPLGRVRDRVGWAMVERAFGRAILPGLNALRRESGLEEWRSALDLYDGRHPIIALTSAPLEYERSALPDHVHLVGAQPWDVPAPRPAYLDEPGDPWVLVTCSTDSQGDQRLAEVAAEALADEPVRVLLTLGGADDAGLAGRLPANVRLERFVPHGHVLPECTAVVCHGGMGIVNRAVQAGVPLVVTPFGRDQPEIARRVQQAGVGVVLPPRRLTAERLRQAVASAVELGPKAREVARGSDAGAAPGRFADAAVGVLRHVERLEA